MYKCKLCGSVCHFIPYADLSDGKFVFFCTNPSCGHKFKKSLFRVIVDDKE